jgi:hypothetical protein
MNATTQMHLIDPTMKKINWIDFSIGLTVLAAASTACLMMAQLFF